MAGSFIFLFYNQFLSCRIGLKQKVLINGTMIIESAFNQSIYSIYCAFYKGGL